MYRIYREPDDYLPSKEKEEKRTLSYEMLIDAHVMSNISLPSSSEVKEDNKSNLKNEMDK